MVKIVGAWCAGEDVESHKGNAYESSRSAVLLEGEKSKVFDVRQGVFKGCSFSPICVH